MKKRTISLKVTHFREKKGILRNEPPANNSLFDWCSCCWHHRQHEEVSHSRQERERERERDEQEDEEE